MFVGSKAFGAADGDKCMERVYNQGPRNGNGSVLNVPTKLMSTRKTRIGLSLFAVYLLLYGGFVLLAAFWPECMEATPLAGVNLAIWYGFGLIVTAIALALVYGWACRPGTPQSGAEAGTTRNDR